MPVNFVANVGSWTVCRYFFYKNLLYTLTQFWFNLWAGYSGQRLYDDW